MLRYGLFCVFVLASLAMFAQDFATPDSASLRTISLSVPVGTPLQIALEREVRVRKVGQVLHGRLVQPVYAFDKLVLPVGSEVTGHISRIDGVPGKKLTLSILNADFTPTHPLNVTFDDLALPDGKHVPLHASVAPGSGQVIRLVSAEENEKKGGVKDAASQKMDQAKQEWQNAMKQIEAPGKAHRLVRLGVAQLPVHPQYIDAGTLYIAELQEPLDFGSEHLPPKVMSGIGSVPPSGSLVRALLLTPPNSSTTPKGSEVQALLSGPLFDGDRLILPEGTRLNGSVLQVRPARRLHHNGQLRMAFHELILPDGTTQRVDTSIEGVQAGDADHARLDSEGGAQATSPKSRYISTGVSVGLALIGSGGRNDVGEGGPLAGGATAFKLVGIAVGLIVRSHTLGILMSAYGGSRSIYSNFLGRGRDIAFPKNTAMEIGFGGQNVSSATTVPK